MPGSFDAKKVAAWSCGIVLLAMFIALSWFGLRSVLADPDVVLLAPEHGARWIRFDEPVEAISRSGSVYIAGFRRTFSLQQAPQVAVLTFKGTRRVNVTLDGSLVCSTGESDAQWKRGGTADLTPYLSPGNHELRITVVNPNGPACALAYCDALDLRTGPGWESTRDGQTWSSAIDAAEPRVLPLSRSFERTDRALLRLLPLYACVFAISFAISLWGSRVGLSRTLRITPGAVRWGLLAAWAVLAVNDCVKLELDQGFDIDQHLEYIRYVASHARIPLATEGWQMFQSPLYYAVSAPFHVLFSMFFGVELVPRLLRVIPLLCGLAQIEVCYRVMRLVYPSRNSLQIMGTLLGGLLPMNTYISQYVSSEAPAALLTGLTVLSALKMLSCASPFAWRRLVPVGVFLGLAMLTKMTPVLLVPPAGMLLCYLAFTREASCRRKLWRAASSMAVVFGLAFLITGWYYVRNYMEMGRFFIGGWDASRGFVWWQDPGYRTPADFVSFGEVLFHPIYATFSGFWDGIYSTFWLDGMISGNGEIACKPHWNYGLLLSGVWFCLAPTLAIVAGFGRALCSPSASARDGLLFAAGCVAIYIAALGYHFLANPYYCAAKAFYTVGIASCYAALGAAGFELFTRWKTLRPIVYGLFACWAFSAYAGYFIL